MAEDFLCKTGPGQVDYTTAALWEAGTQCDLTAATTLVFAHGGITGTIADNASVSGVTSSATATVVHCSATQILLETIASGPFQDGEVVQVSAGNSVTISDTGLTVVVVGECGTTGAVDAPIGWAGATTDSTNFRKLAAQEGHEATQPWDTARYIMKSSAGSDVVDLGEDYAEFDHIQLEHAPTSDWRYGLDVQATGVKVNGCVIWSSNTRANCHGIYIHDASVDHLIENTFVYSFSENGIQGSCNSAGISSINCTVYGCGHYGLTTSSGDGLYIVNNLSYNNTDADFSASVTGGSLSYNFSKDDTAGTGTGCIRGDTDGKTPDFVSTTDNSEDLHLQSSSDAIDAGIGPGSAAYVSALDFDGNTRAGATCAIGADEYAALGSWTGTADFPLVQPDFAITTQDLQTASAAFVLTQLGFDVTTQDLHTAAAALALTAPDFSVTTQDLQTASAAFILDQPNFSVTTQDLQTASAAFVLTQLGFDIEVWNCETVVELLLDQPTFSVSTQDLQTASAAFSLTQPGFSVVTDANYCDVQVLLTQPAFQANGVGNETASCAFVMSQPAFAILTDSGITSAEAVIDMMLNQPDFSITTQDLQTASAAFTLTQPVFQVDVSNIEADVSFSAPIPTFSSYVGADTTFTLPVPAFQVIGWWSDVTVGATLRKPSFQVVEGGVEPSGGFSGGLIYKIKRKRKKTQQEQLFDEFLVLIRNAR